MEHFGRYQLVRKLATGGMGQVYLARQKGPVGFEKVLVVKRLLPHLCEEQDFIHMFFDEARIAAHLNHPNIAQIFDLGDVEGQYFIAMEHVHGESLRAVNELSLKTKLGFPLGLKLRVIADAAAGLDFAHRARSPKGKELHLIHRDVSPQNILLGFNGSVKVIDFGVAKATGKISSTGTGIIKGKYAYMSPEQARGREIDGRSDIFGLGVILYELLTEKRLFKRDSDNATLKAVVTEKVPAPSKVVKGLPKALDAVLAKALEKNAEDRYQTAADLQLALEEVMTAQRLPGTSAHLASWLRQLYPVESAEDVLAGEGTRSEIFLPPSESSSKKPGRSKEEKSTKSKKALVAPDDEASVTSLSVELDHRLAQVPARAQVPGFFFQAVLALVEKRKGLPAARDAASELDLTYPVSEDRFSARAFLELLLRSGAPLGATIDKGLGECGAACLEAVLKAPEGAPILAPAPNAREVMARLYEVLSELVPTGERVVEAEDDRSVTVVLTDERMPYAFHAGLASVALLKVRQLRCHASWKRSSGDAVTLKLTWG